MTLKRPKPHKRERERNSSRYIKGAEYPETPKKERERNPSRILPNRHNSIEREREK